MAASAVLHVAFAAAIFYVAHDARWGIPARQSSALAFVVLEPPVPPRVIPTQPLRLPPVVKEEPKIREAVPVEIAPIPDRVLARVEPAPPAPEPRRADPIAPQRPKPAPPTVTVGVFAPSGNSAHATELSRTVQGAGFDAPAARAPAVQPVSAAVGAFESSVGVRPQPGTDRPNVVGDAGFGTRTAIGPSRPAARLADAGFGTAVATAPARLGGRGLADGGFDAGRGDAGRGRLPSQAVKATDFDARAPQAAAPQAARQSPVEVPLEILSKPTPAYTDEARALKIEGEVLLEVEFTATGEIRVLKVVRGLGHGLDESATRAVQGMRFKPAQRNGQPTDVRTTVNIVFQLA